ncbi:MAG: site-specific integrase [Fuerstiella sp.]
MFATRAEAESFRVEMVQSIATGTEITNDTLGFIVESWLDQIRATKDKNTHTAYSYSVAPFAQLYDVPAMDIRPFNLQKVLNGLTGRRAQMSHDKIRQCLQWAVRFGLLPSDPSSGLDRPHHERQAIEVFTDEEVRKILAESQHHRFHAAVRLALSVGLRGGEVWGLKWSDWDGTELKIQRQATEHAGIVRIKIPKKNSVRTVSLPDSVVQALEVWNRQRVSEGFAGCEWIFPDSQGNVTRRSNFSSRTWRPLLKACHLRVRGFHHCRHTAATMMLNHNVPITSVARTLGHKDAATTLSIYAHLMTSELDRHRNRFDEVISAG